jgi:hypothetical protein
MDLPGRSVGCLSRRWSKIRAQILVGARLAPSPALAVGSHRSGYRTGTHAQFEQSVGSSEKHVRSVVDSRLVWVDGTPIFEQFQFSPLVSHSFQPEPSPL